MTRVFRLEDPDAPDDAGPRTGVRERITRDEADELVAVRALLCELRPGDTRDPRGPLAWSPMGPEPAHTEPKLGALAKRIRVQESADPSPVPRDAFAEAAPVASGVEIAAEIREVALAGGPEPAAVLLWLQRAGTVHDGLPALCIALADALAPESLRTRWAPRGAVGIERRRQWGLDAIAYAARWWCGERPVCAGAWQDCTAAWTRTGGTIVTAAARCQRPEKVRVRGPRCRRGV